HAGGTRGVEREVDGAARDVVAAAECGLVADGRAAHRAVAGDLNLRADRRTGRYDSNRLVVAVVLGAGVEAVAAIDGVPGVGADLRGRHGCRGVVIAIAVDRDGSADLDGGVVRLRQVEGDGAGRLVGAVQRGLVAQDRTAHHVADLMGVGGDLRLGV